MAVNTSQTEQEDAAWEEKKQMRERLSHIMGQYLLKGYRMLGTNCPECEVLYMCIYKATNTLPV